LLIEAAKRANRVRDAEVADPAHAGDVAPFLEAAWLDAEAMTIDRKRAAPWPAAGQGGDTVWMGAIDARGLAISFIQSIFWEFGSGVVSPRTGIVWQNRGSSFSLDPASRNALAPGKKPFHTLNPPLARFDDGRTMVYGSMGGDGQPQFQAQIFTRAARFGMEVGDALALPRWRFGRVDGDEAEVTMENRFDPDLVTALERAGHAVLILGDGYSDSMGHAGMIVRRSDGRLFGASDPRSDGAAVSA
jgi:gamma-glutamyltranspeptidase/glutathione hydrolase